MKYCISLINHDIHVEQRASKLFRVTYGKQVQDNLTYAEAAHEFGECVFHALSCEGAIDNSGA